MAIRANGCDKCKSEREYTQEMKKEKSPRRLVIEDGGGAVTNREEMKRTSGGL